MMRPSDAGLEFLKDREECRLQTFDDATGKDLLPGETPIGNATIGWGHKIQPHESLPWVITQQQADTLLEMDLTAPQSYVNNLVKAPLSQHQFDALVCLCFNCGCAPLMKTLGHKLNALDYAGAAEEFLLWDHAGGKVNKGLLARRRMERELFLST